MFMRYRGGGIGHKYMRAIEAAYENMSRKRIHGKGRTHRPVNPEEVVADADDDGDSADNEAEPTGTQAVQGAQGNRQENVTHNCDRDDDDEDDDDYAPSSDESHSSGVSNSDDLDSDEHEGFEEIYGFGDL
jgi:hypothetical protein